MLDSGLHETILFRTPHTDEGNMTPACRSKSQPAPERESVREKTSKGLKACYVYDGKKEEF